MTAIGPLTYASARGEYYHHSGKFDLGRTIFALMVICILAVIVGGGYSYTLVTFRYARIFTLLLAAFSSILLGVVWRRLLIWANVRNLVLAIWLSAFVGLLLLWVCWVFYIFFQMPKIGNWAALLWRIVISPRWLWKAILLYNQFALRSWQDATIKGLVIWGLWILEAMELMLFPIWNAYKGVTEHLFCEHCRQWGAVNPLVNLRPSKEMNRHLKAQMEVKNFAFLTTLEESASWENVFVTLSLEGCRVCRTTQTVSADKILLTLNRGGQYKTKITPLIKRLWLTPEETIFLTQAVEAIKNRTNQDQPDTADHDNIGGTAP